MFASELHDDFSLLLIRFEEDLGAICPNSNLVFDCMISARLKSIGVAVNVRMKESFKDLYELIFAQTVSCLSEIQM